MAFYQGHTHDATEEQKRRILRKAILVSVLVLWFFTFLGDVILFLLQINVNYIRITGGVYILVYSVKDVLFGEEPKEVDLGALKQPPPAWSSATIWRPCGGNSCATISISTENKASWASRAGGAGT